MAATPTETLTEDQQSSLTQFLSITDQETAAALALLRKSEWNVQIALTKFYDGDSPDPIPEPPSPAETTASAIFPAPQNVRRRENLHQTFLNPYQPGLRRSGLITAPRISEQAELPIIFTIILVPFRLIERILYGALWLLSRILTFLPPPDPYYFQRGKIRRHPNASGAMIREKPDETAQVLNARITSQYGEIEGLTHKGYNNSLDLVRREARMLLVVLLSIDDINNAHFMTHVLTSDTMKAFVIGRGDTLRIWLGCDSDEEAYTLAPRLGFKTLPALALISPTPRDDSSSLSLSIIARTSALKDPENVAEMLGRAIERHSTPLQTIRSQLRSHESARTMRNEQESAYERSLAQDREKKRRRMQAEEEMRRLEVSEQQKRDEAQAKVERRERWRRSQARRLKIKAVSSDKAACRVCIRLRDGTRVIERFKSDARMSELYLYVECYDLLIAGDEKADSLDQAEDDAEWEPGFDFRLVQTMPRHVFEPNDASTLQKAIGKSGNLVVEALQSE